MVAVVRPVEAVRACEPGRNAASVLQVPRHARLALVHAAAVRASETLAAT